MRKYCGRCLCVLLLLVCAVPVLFGSDAINDLMHDWFAAESALYRWLVADAGSVAAGSAELCASLRVFRASLNDFTGSLLFQEFERTWPWWQKWQGWNRKPPAQPPERETLFSKESGAALCRAADSLIACAESSRRNDAVSEAAAIRNELYSWLRLDSRTSSQVFGQFVFTAGVFLLSVIAFIVTVLFLYRALRRSRMQEQNSTDFSRAAIMAQEDERAVVSAELHDTVLQDLGRLLQISGQLPVNEKPSPSPAAQIQELTMRIMTRTQEICRSLMPPNFSRVDLADSLVQLCVDFENRNSIECRSIIAPGFTNKDLSQRLSPKMQLQVYRIVQEALTNIEKHAGAGEVTVTARNRDGSCLIVCISDDGIGMDIDAMDSKKPDSRDGLGIRGMYQRAAMLGASLSFVGGAGSGLTVRLELPLPRALGDKAS